MFSRALESKMDLGTPPQSSFLLLGPRQTGKSTFIETHLTQIEGKKLVFRLQDTRTFHEVSKRPALVMEAVTAAASQSDIISLFIDEIQLVPELVGICRDLSRQFPGKLRSYLTASSVRKLRRIETGSSDTASPFHADDLITRHLHALSLPEFQKTEAPSLLPCDRASSLAKTTDLPGETALYRFEDILTCGTLPGVVACPAPMRGELLRSYVSAYLERDIRDEALTRHLGAFARFLELAASADGSAPNLSKIAQGAGLPVSTVKNYFDVLEDTFVTVRVPAFTESGRKRAFTTPRFFFFDTGFRNAAAGFTIDANLTKTQGEILFRNFMTVETIRRLSYRAPDRTRFSHWNATSGAGVDLVVETGGETIPLAFTFAKSHARRDTRHLKTFMKEFGAKRGYLIGRFAETGELENGITALPWDRL
jgi:predicted AAA+ superfamily ATPase